MLRKIAIGGSIVAVVVITFLFLQTRNSKRDIGIEPLPSPESFFPISDILVGIYDPMESPSEYTKLLEARIQAAGFQTVILRELVDPASSESDKTTLLFTTSTQRAQDVFAKEIIASPVYRKGLNEGIEQDIVISSWNMEDINWGSYSKRAEALNVPKKEEVSILLVAGSAQKNQALIVESILKESGYEKVSREENNSERSKPLVIYYGRNKKNTAKDIRSYLSGRGWSGATYTSRLTQDADIVIELGEGLIENLSGENYAIPQDQLSLKKDAKILILNGSGVSGYAANAENMLKNFGYSSLNIGNASGQGYVNVSIKSHGDFINTARDIGQILQEFFGSYTISQQDNLENNIEVILGKSGP